jgi:periplasmic divalent cation tolerance protein
VYKLIYITTPTKKEAEKIARVLVKERLAACVNMFPLKSIFRWKGRILKEKEVALVVKSKNKLVSKIIKRAKELHSYEVPCIISLPIEKGLPEFLRWIEKETRK